MADHREQNEQSDLMSAVQTLVSALQGHLQQQTQQAPQAQQAQQGTGQGQIVRQTTTVQQEMARSFPAMFQRPTGKRRFPAATKICKTTKVPKEFTGSFCLLNENCVHTPSSEEELALFQAGLGRRCLTLTEDINHSEIQNLLGDAYPKLLALLGGWVLKKASGGNGKRKLMLISPHNEGYTGAQIKSASLGGKVTLYIAPLQDNLDLTPLPANSKEFENMLKADCKTCNQSFPLQVLAVHVGSCRIDLSSSENEEEKDDECPICHGKFTFTELPLHASNCGERFENNPNAAARLDLDTILCEEDVLSWLAGQIDHTKDFNLCVARDQLVERGMMLWQRQKKSSPINPLKITFLGEAGIDTGALRVEFLTEMVSGIAEKLFEGQEGKGMVPKYSLNFLDSGLFRVAGEVFATSLAQGGPAPCFLQEWCYNYLTTGELIDLAKEKVFDLELSPLIEQIAETEDIGAFIGEIIDCGYTGQINAENKANIIRTILLHATTKRTPMLDHLRQGLNLYGFLKVLETKPEHCRGLFVAGSIEDVDAHYILSSLSPQLSSSAVFQQKEKAILNYFQDLLLELEDKDPDDQDQPTIGNVMQWLTGQSHRHLRLRDRADFKIVVCFQHDCIMHNSNHTVCYPIVSACTQTITFPAAHLNSFEEFKQNMLIALRCGGEFHRT